MTEEPTRPGESSDVGANLAAALQDEQFFLVYQPTIDLETNAFAGVEALIRWRHPARGVLSPDVFLPALEASGAILEVGRWALRTACNDGASWHDKGYRFNVSVNVSKEQLEFDGFYDDVANAIAASRFDPGLLVLEFTQGTLTTDKKVSERRLARLRTLGVRFA